MDAGGGLASSRPLKVGLPSTHTTPQSARGGEGIITLQRCAITEREPYTFGGLGTPLLRNPYHQTYMEAILHEQHSSAMERATPPLGLTAARAAPFLMRLLSVFIASASATRRRGHHTSRRARRSKGLATVIKQQKKSNRGCGGKGYT